MPSEEKAQNPPVRTVSKESEFYISFIQQKGHTSIMIGYIDENGDPQGIARVGKWIMDPDLAFNNPILTQMAMITKGATVGAYANIASERIYGSKEYPNPVTYEAHAITYRQIKEFLMLIQEMRSDTISNDTDGTMQLLLHYARQKEINCYVPTNETEDSITFEFKDLCTSELPNTALKGDVTKLIQSSQVFEINNNCRTTAKMVIEYMVGIKSDVSRFIFRSPNYSTILRYSVPEKNSFYVLPPPPQAFSDKNLSAAQVETLESLYKQIKKIPQKHGNLELTHKKFNELKSMYTKISGQPNLGADALLIIISQSDESLLQSKRNPNYLSRLLGINTSSTKKNIDEIKKNLSRKIDPDFNVKPTLYQPTNVNKGEVGGIKDEIGHKQKSMREILQKTRTEIEKANESDPVLATNEEKKENGVGGG